MPKIPRDTSKPGWFDRLLDFLLDRNHPFWQDERQGAVYNEASAAALQLQAFVLLPVASVCLLLWGRAVLGAVIVLTVVCSLSQYLVFGILRREHVELFPPDWQKQVSPARRVVAPASAFTFVFACVWVQQEGEWFDGIGMRLAMIGVVVVECAVLALVLHRATTRRRREPR